MAPVEAQPKPHDGVLYNHPRPDIEHIIWHAETLRELTPRAFAALSVTPELVARAVAEPGVARLFSHDYPSARPLKSAMYSLWLVVQMDLKLDRGEQYAIWQQWPKHAIHHLAYLVLHKGAGEFADQYESAIQHLAQTAPSLHAEARAILDHRLPLDWPIVSRLLELTKGELDQGQRSRLRVLLPQITARAILELSRKWRDLTPSFRTRLKGDLEEALAAGDPRLRLAQALGQPAATVPAATPVQGPTAGRPSASRAKEPASAPAKSPSAPPASVAATGADWRFWSLCAAGVIVFLGWLHAYRRARALASSVCLCLAVSAAQAQETPFHPGPLRHPEIEKLLEAAKPIEAPITALKLARLATTPRLIAEMVLKDDLASYVATGNVSRPKLARIYGLFLAFHVGHTLTEPELRYLAMRESTDIRYAARMILAHQWPQNERYQHWFETHTADDEGRRLAREVLTLRMPLDRDILAEVVRLAHADGEVAPGRLKRLGAMWHRLDDTGRKYLAAQRLSLPPLLRQTIEKRGIPPERAGQGR